MNVYKYIWDPVKNTNITLTSKQGKQLLKKYITNLVGGSVTVFLKTTRSRHQRR